jgi:hypothetical protein
MIMSTQISIASPNTCTAEEDSSSDSPKLKSRILIATAFYVAGNHKPEK